MKILVIMPTLNESRNVTIQYKKIRQCLINSYILFVDDNSSDGTISEIKNLQKKDKKINLIVRSGKLGIGSAHKDAFKFAYKKKFDIAVTLDADGTHDPLKIPTMLKFIKNYEIIITNRFKNKKALKNWHWMRKLLTLLRYYLINFVLEIDFDTSGAFRCYNLRKISLKHLLQAQNNSYSFFWESTHILNKLKYKIKEIPIILPYRKIGISKMNFTDILSALMYLLYYYVKKI